MDIFGSKLKEVTQAILTKECTLEDVLTDIKECGFGLKQSWEALEEACRNLKCSKLKGRIGLRDSVCYVEVMILSDIASLILDVMSASLSKASKESLSRFFISKVPEVILEESHVDSDVSTKASPVSIRSIESVRIHVDEMISQKMHLILPVEDVSFESREIGVSLGPLVLDLKEKTWNIDLTLTGTPKDFVMPEKTKATLVRFEEF